MEVRELATAIAERLLTAGCTACPSLSSQVIAADATEDPDSDGAWAVLVENADKEFFFIHVNPMASMGAVHYPNGLDDPQPYSGGES